MEKLTPEQYAEALRLLNYHTAKADHFRAIVRAYNYAEGKKKIENVKSKATSQPNKIWVKKKTITLTLVKDQEATYLVLKGEEAEEAKEMFNALKRKAEEREKAESRRTLATELLKKHWEKETKAAFDETVRKHMSYVIGAIEEALSLEK